MTIHITRDNVRTGLKALVDAEGEDFVYQGRGERGICLYVWDGEPDCMIAQFLVGQGVALDDIAEYEHVGAGEVLAGLQDEGKVTIEEGVDVALDSAQVYQDQGRPWGMAFREALTSLLPHEMEDARWEGDGTHPF